MGTVGGFFLQGESPAEEALRDDGRSPERSSLSCPGTGTGKCLAKGDFMSEVDKPPGVDAQRWDTPPGSLAPHAAGMVFGKARRRGGWPQ